MLDERQVADLMRHEIDAEPPSGVLDIDRAMRTGRRQRRAARAAGGALLAGALVAGAAVAPGLLATERPPAAQPAGPAAGGPTGLPAALTTVDPQRVYVRFGWLPAGTNRLSYHAGLLQTGPGVLLGADSRRDTRENWRGVSVRLYPKGAQPLAPQRDDGTTASVTGTDAGPELNGGPSSWTVYSPATGPEAVLRWRYAPDGWAEVRVVGTEGEARDTATRVARALRFGDDPVPMPATVGGVPDGLRLLEVSVSESVTGPHTWYAGTTWTAEPATAEPGRQRARTLSVGFSRAGGAVPGARELPAPNTTVDGRRAYRQGDRSLLVYDVDGVDVSIEHAGVLPAGGTGALFGTVRPRPGVSGWHTHLRG
ncbi:hypothetical protein ACWENR_11520 [Micromonospora sp. NPDC004336]